jgi:hypothetical protein
MSRFLLHRFAKRAPDGTHIVFHEVTHEMPSWFYRPHVPAPGEFHDGGFLKAAITEVYQAHLEPKVCSAQGCAAPSVEAYPFFTHSNMCGLPVPSITVLLLPVCGKPACRLEVHHMQVPLDSTADDEFIRANRACDICGVTEGLKICAGCGATPYCGREHQEEDWARHKPVCKHMRKILETNPSLRKSLRKFY